MKVIVFRNLLYFGTIFSTLISVTLLRATEHKTQFQQGLDDYKTGQFQEAAAEFRELALSESTHPLMSASFLMWARSLLKQHDYNQVFAVTSQLLMQYPESGYVDDAHYVRAEVYFDLGKSGECADELTWVITKGTDERLVERAKHHLKSLCQLMLSERERRGLVAQVHDLAVQRIILGLDETNLSDQGIVIGVVLPLSGPDHDLGEGLQQGIEYALSSWKETSTLPLFLSFYDSRGSAYEAARISQDKLELEKVSMLLCAGDEGVATACATQAISKHVPCLILNPQIYPLSSLGEEIFQLYPDRGTEGEALAECAVRSLGLRTFAVLTSANSDGEEMARGFIETVNKIGGRILVQEWFYPGSLNFEKQFVRIRKLGMDIMEASIPDTSSISVVETPTDSIWANMTNGEVLGSKATDDDESMDISVNVFDGFFIAPDPGDVNILAPQYAFYNFTTQLLGSHDWDNQESFQKNRNYISGMVYSTNVFWDPGSVSDSEWINDFRNSTGQVPTEIQIMGYDAMRWVLTAIDSLANEGLILQGENSVQYSESTPPLSPPTSVVGESSTPPFIPPAKQGGNWSGDTLQHNNSCQVRVPDSTLNISLSPERLLERLQEQTKYQGIGGLYRFRDGMNTRVSIVRYEKGRKELLNKE